MNTVGRWVPYIVTSYTSRIQISGFLYNYRPDDETLATPLSLRLFPASRVACSTMWEEGVTPRYQFIYSYPGVVCGTSTRRRNSRYK